MNNVTHQSHRAMQQCGHGAARPVRCRHRHLTKRIARIGGRITPRMHYPGGPQYRDDQRRNRPECKRVTPSTPRLRHCGCRKPGRRRPAGDACGVDARRRGDMIRIVAFGDDGHQYIADRYGRSEHHRADPYSDPAGERTDHVPQCDGDERKQDRAVDANTRGQRRNQRAHRGERHKRNRSQQPLQSARPAKIGANAFDHRADRRDGGAQIQRNKKDQRRPQSRRLTIRSEVQPFRSHHAHPLPLQVPTSTFRRIATATVSLYTPVRICHMRDGAFRHTQGYGTLAVPMFHCSEGCSHGLRFLPRYRCDL